MKYTLIFSGLLIGYRNFGLVIDSEIPYAKIKFIEQANLPIVLAILILFFTITFSYCWFKSDKDNRSIFFFIITVASALLAVAPEIYKYLLSFQIDWKVILSSVAVFSLGVIPAITIGIIFLVTTNIRRSGEMIKYGVGRIPPACKALIACLAFLIPLNLVTLIILHEYLTNYLSLLKNYWYIFYALPSAYILVTCIIDLADFFGLIKWQRKPHNKISALRKAIKLHEMHYQHIGIEPIKKYQAPDICQLARKNKTDELEKILNSGFDPDSQDGRGWTALMWASAEKHQNAVDLLLEHGADPNIENYLGRTAIMYAAKYGHTKIVQNLINHDAEVNPTKEFSDRPPLLAAASAGYLDVVKLLTEKGADIFHRNQDGQTALDLAMKGGHGKVAKYLRKAMKSTADLNKKRSSLSDKTDWL